MTLECCHYCTAQTGFLMLFQELHGRNSNNKIRNFHYLFSLIITKTTIIPQDMATVDSQRHQILYLNKQWLQLNDKD